MKLFPNKKFIAQFEITPKISFVYVDSFLKTNNVEAAKLAISKMSEDLLNKELVQKVNKLHEFYLKSKENLFRKMGKLLN